MSLANELGMRPLMAYCHDGLGRLYRQIGRNDDSREYLAKAIAMFKERGMNFWLEDALKERVTAILGIPPPDLRAFLTVIFGFNCCC